LGLPTGGNEASVQALTRRELVEFHRVHWRPGNAVLLFAGDITRAEAARLAGDCLGGWEAGAVPQVGLPAASPPEGIRVALVDRQDAPQSQIRIGSIGPARKVADYHAIELMNAVLGGSFSSRLNLNLREDKGYTYGASTRFAYARQGGFWVGGTAVQTSVTTQTLLELHKEIAAIGEARPITQAELSAAQQNLVRGFAQRFETVGRVADQMSELFAYDLPLETLAGYPAAIDSVPLEQVRAAARRYLDETRLLVVVVGDLKQLEDPVRQLDLGPVEIVDPGGKPVCS
jgi:zinc protease